MKLSIIIPFYNALPYFNELLDSLMPQITDDIEVIFVDDLYEDLSRRDFTINALAYDENVIDYFDGISDIKNKIIIKI